MSCEVISYLMPHHITYHIRLLRTLVGMICICAAMRSSISPALALTVSLRGPQSSSWDRDWGGLKPVQRGGGEVLVRGEERGIEMKE